MAVLALALAAALIAAAIGSQPASAAKLTRGIATGTAYFNKVETKDIARSGTAGIAALCGPIGLWNGPAGVACAAYAGTHIVQANRAVNRNMCLKLKFSPPTFPYIGVTWPDIYRGGYCT